MDPVSQTLAQQSSGSAEGQGFGQFFLQGAQLGQERKRINLAQQRLDIEKAQEARQAEQFNLMRPYLKQQYDNQSKLLGMKVKENANALELQTRQMAIIPDLQDLQLDFLSSPLGYADPELRSRAHQIFGNDPKARYSQAGQEVMQGINGINVINQEFNVSDQALARFGSNLKEVNPKTGAIQFNNPTADETPAIKNFMFEQKLKAKVDAYPEGSFEHNLYKQMLSDFQTHASSTTTDLIEKRITAYEKVVGPLTQEGKKRIADIVSGLAPRIGADHPLDENRFINQHLDQVMSTPSIPSEDKPGKMRVPKSREEGINWLRSEFNFITKGTPLPQGKAAPAKEAGLLDRLLNKASPAPAARSTLAPDEVWMISPPDATGRRIKGKVPKNKVDELKQQGYEPYEG